MKIKILLFPLIILVIFYLSVAHIFPDWQRTKELKTEIDGNNKVLESIQEKQNNMASLYTQISSDIAHKSDLEEIVPKMRTEEVIIDTAHQLAQNHGVALLQMTFGDVQSTNARPRTEALAQAIEYADPSNVQIGVQVSGSYNSTKEFLDNFAHILRAHTSATMAISRSDGSQDGEEGGGLQDSLETEVVYNYPFMDEITLQNSDMKTLQHPAQNKDQFDMTPIDEWIAMTRDNVTDLQLGEYGRGSSPFMP